MTDMEQTKVYTVNVLSLGRDKQQPNSLLGGHRPADLKILKKDLTYISHGSIYTPQTHKQHVGTTWLELSIDFHWFLYSAEDILYPLALIETFLNVYMVSKAFLLCLLNLHPILYYLLD